MVEERAPKRGLREIRFLLSCAYAFVLMAQPLDTVEQASTRTYSRTFHIPTSDLISATLASLNWAWRRCIFKSNVNFLCIGSKLVHFSNLRLLIIEVDNSVLYIMFSLSMSTLTLFVSVCRSHLGRREKSGLFGGEHSWVGWGGVHAKKRGKTTNERTWLLFESGWKWREGGGGEREVMQASTVVRKIE